jgi:hypothetical protein
MKPLNRKDGNAPETFSGIVNMRVAKQAGALSEMKPSFFPIFAEAHGYFLFFEDPFFFLLSFETDFRSALYPLLNSSLSRF